MDEGSRPSSTSGSRPPGPRRLALVFGALWCAGFALFSGFEDPEFRPWEVLGADDSLGFVPDGKVEMDEYGDLAFRNHLPELRRYHHKRVHGGPLGGTGTRERSSSRGSS